MAHWLSSQPGLKELEEEGHKLTTQVEEDLKKLLQRRRLFWKFVASLSEEDKKQ